MLELDFIDIAYGIILNSSSASRVKLLWLLESLTIDSDKVWLKIFQCNYLLDSIVDLMQSYDIKLRLEALRFMVNFISRIQVEANAQLLL